MPFLRAFMIFMDFETNQIAFTNKLNNYGAFITEDFEDNKGLPAPPEEDFDDGHGHSFHHDKNGRSGVDSGTDEDGGGINMSIMIAAGGVLACVICLIVFFVCKKRR